MRGTSYHGDDEEVENFLNVLDIPKLTEEQKHMCEGRIFQKECELMLETFQNNKAPGNDGIPVEFYKRFWTLLSDPFVNCANECFENMEMSNSQKQAVISVIEKKGKDRTLLENWTPTFLVNVDAKLMSKVVANRLKIVLPFSIITQVIIEILALSLAENSVIFHYNHLRRGDYSGRTNFQNNRPALCQCVRRVH